MTLYAGHMTSANQAAYELQQAIGEIMMIDSNAVEGFEFGELGTPPCVVTFLPPAQAIELAEWIRSNTQASRDNPNQLRLF